MQGGGRPLEWMKPVRLDGRRHEDRVGTYAAQFDHWNVRPEPGFEYRHVHDVRGRVGSLLRLGYEVCSSPNMGAYGEHALPHRSSQQDGVQRDGQMVLIRIPVSLYAKRRMEKVEKAKTQLTGTPFLSQARPGEESQENRPIRFKLPGHGIEVKQSG